MPLTNFERIIQEIGDFDFRQAQIDAIVQNGDELVLMQQQQLAAGTDITGAKRIDSYTPQYARLKVKKFTGLGAAVDRVTFYARGTMYDMLKLHIEGDQLEVTDDFIGIEGMIDRIGPENYGINPDNRLKFAEDYTIPTVKAVFRLKVFG